MSELESPEVEKEIGKAMTKRKNGKLVTLKLNKIKPYPDNSKIHTEAQVKDIANSLITFGYTTKIEVDENNQVLSGHGRLRAFYMIDPSGTKEIEVLKITDFTDQEKIAYRLAANETNQKTGYDLKILKTEFKKLEGSRNLKDTGFSLKRIDTIVKRIENTETTNVSAHKRKLNKDHKCPKCGFDLREEE